jgi:hypothetical protein
MTNESCEGYLPQEVAPTYIAVSMRHTRQLTPHVRAALCLATSINGAVTAAEHNLGGVSANSPFTSWTHDINVARGYAGADGVILRVPTGAPPPGAGWSWHGSPDVFRESEVLLRGVREGCTVLCPK